MANENKGPVRKYRSGALSLTVWENAGKDESTFETFDLQRGYKDNDDQWKNTHTLRVSDLPRAYFLIGKAYMDSVVKTE